MSHLYLVLKLIHILGGTVLLGTGLGIAFFMVMAHRAGDAVAVAQTARIVVVADSLFTASAVLVLPLSGWAMALMTGVSTSHWWIKATLVLYVFVGLCWLPAVWLQLKMRDLAIAAASSGKALPARYHTLFKIWFYLGWPALAGVFAILVLMLWKPHW
jgi:uncharacterized membrane protein